MGMSLGGPGGRRRSRRDKPFSEINITPMVDVMLVLLVIFMVAAPMMTTGVSVELPKTNAAPIPGQDEPLMIAIKADGKIYLQNVEIKLKDLQAKLKAITGEKKDTRIFIRGDKSVDYGQVMQAVSEINAAGFGKVALLTDPNAADKGK